MRRTHSSRRCACASRRWATSSRRRETSISGAWPSAVTAASDCLMGLSLHLEAGGDLPTECAGWLRGAECTSGGKPLRTDHRTSQARFEARHRPARFHSSRSIRPRQEASLFFTYLARELRRRRRQAFVVALGLALGVGLVVTVSAMAAGVRSAQGKVLKSLYGV